MSPETALPGALLLVGFLLKLFIDRTASVADIILALLELPVDMAFLATSFVAGFSIANPTHASDGILTFCVYLAATVLVVVFWRRSRRYYTSDHLAKAGTIGALNCFLCVAGLVYSVALLTGGTP